MRSIADGPDEAVVVLEDDIDMEFDLEKRLRGMWPALPKNWDIVMIGMLLLISRSPSPSFTKF